jgi:hypothetical protein
MDYGGRKLLPDGSCIRTKFYVFFYIPLWPIKSYRVRHESQKFLVRMTPVSLHWPHVIKFLALGYGLLLILPFVLRRVLLGVISFMEQVL